MHLLPFKNQYRDHDFTLILDVIKKHYPAGKGKGLNSRTLPSSPRFKKVKKVVTSEFLDEKSYQAKWGKLTSHLKKAFDCTVYGYPDLRGGGFLGEVILSEDKQPDFIRQKSLRFYVSIIGPFFSIHGVDSSIAILPIESRSPDFNKGNFAATHAVTLSPVFEYAEPFTKLEDELREYFPGFLFVPQHIGMSTIKNISMADSDQDSRMMDTIYEGLYGHSAVYSCLARGDRYYGMADWVTPLSKNEKSLVNLISKHVVTASGETTLHKVWKLQESKRLESLKISGNLMMGLDVYDVIDMTDKSTIITMSARDRGSPSSAKYKLIDDVIILPGNTSLKIISVTQEHLTLHLVIDFKGKGVSAKGAAVEMKYVQMKKLQ